MKCNMVVEELSSECSHSHGRVVFKQIFEFSQFKNFNYKIQEYEIKHSVVLSCIKNNARLCLQSKINFKMKCESSEKKIQSTSVKISTVVTIM